MITFQNEGLLSPVSIATFGVSVKENKNPIGFFGTGLKYALAVLLRNNQHIYIQSGPDHMLFTKQSVDVRGKPFELVCMSINNEPAVQLGFTTELGKQWQLWMAYRELACNCMDEGGNVKRLSHPPAFTDDITSICVSGDAFEDIFHKRGEFILSSAPMLTLGEFCEVRQPSTASDTLFYRNVLVGKLPVQSIFQYNLLAKMTLTEDRTLSDSWYVPLRISEAVLQCTDRAFLKTVLTAPKNTFEGSKLDFMCFGGQPSPQFLAVVEELCEDKSFDCNESARKLYEVLTKKAFAPVELALTPVQTKMLERAMLFCTRIGFPIAASSYPVKFVYGLGLGVLGLADHNTDTIYVSEAVFHSGGTKALASVLIEEYLHLSKGYADLTRELQTFLFDKIVSMGEDLRGEPL